MKLINLAPTPAGLTAIQKRNFRNVQIDGIAVGLATASAPFLPVFLARLGATNLQVGLLTSMPAITGLFLAIIVGRFLQTRKQVVPWFSAARLAVIACYALTGIVPFFVPHEFIVPIVLAIWAIATLPQIIVNVAFSVVMNGVAGPKYRYDLMSRRWSTLGLATAISVAIAGQILDRIQFPYNYQIVFFGFSLAGLLSFYYSSHIDLPNSEPPPRVVGESLRTRIRNFAGRIQSQPAFISFMLKRFVFFSGMTLGVPLFPLYYVRDVNASNAWIGIINTAQTGVMLLGYFWWAQQSKERGSRFVLLWTTLGLSLYPIFTALTLSVEWIAFYALLSGIFQAGLDLVFFDELMKTFPAKDTATFVSLAQSAQYISTVASPLVGTFLADHIGIPGALVVSGVIRFLGFAWFLLGKPAVTRAA